MVNGNLEVNITTLKEVTIEMIRKCEEAIEKSVESIVNKDVGLAREVIKQDDDIDNLRVSIIEKSIELIALKQPMAKDLRTIYSLDHIALELERIGDYSVNIAMETIKIGKEDHVEALIDIPKMKEVCITMLKYAEESFKTGNTKLAYKCGVEDDIVDDLYNDVYVDVVAAMHKDERNINQGVKLIYVGRCLERIGDHITNICENIIYSINGEMVEIG